MTQGQRRGPDDLLVAEIPGYLQGPNPIEYRGGHARLAKILRLPVDLGRCARQHPWELQVSSAMSRTRIWPRGPRTGNGVRRPVAAAGKRLTTASGGRKPRCSTRVRHTFFARQGRTKQPRTSAILAARQRAEVRDGIERHCGASQTRVSRAASSTARAFPTTVSMQSRRNARVLRCRRNSVRDPGDRAESEVAQWLGRYGESNEKVALSESRRLGRNTSSGGKGRDPITRHGKPAVAGRCASEEEWFEYN